MTPELAVLCADLADALELALDCKGPYEGTVSEKGGEPAVCPRCSAEARDLLARVERLLAK